LWLIGAMSDPAPPVRPLAGILWMLGSGLSFVGVTGIVRHLGTDLPAGQSSFLRFAWGALFLAPSLWPILRAGVPGGTWGYVVSRGAVHSVAVFMWFYAMARIPVAEVTAIGYLSPVCVTIGAALVFGEKLAARRIGAVLVAVAGALIVLRPGMRELGSGHLAQLCAAVLFAASYLIAKRLTQRMAPGAVVALLSLSVTIGLLPVAVAVWVPITVAQLAWLALVALFGTAGHYCMTRAFMLAPLAVTQPVTFLQIIWSAALGALVFAEAIDPFVILGGAIIIAAVSLNTWAEARQGRRGVPAAVET
jgi:drug/metabolite transporter (DMT)-like permease